MPIDTQHVVEKLTGAGVPDQQARAHASVLADALQNFDGQTRHRFVTKQELVEALAPIHEALIRLEARMDAMEAKIDAVDAKIDTKIDSAVSKLKAEVALWIVSAGFVQTGIIAALVLEIAT
ncbi:MAG TPA: hypothetical protein VGE60_10765 [Telluria sp.]